MSDLLKRILLPSFIAISISVLASQPCESYANHDAVPLKVLDDEGHPEKYRKFLAYSEDVELKWTVVVNEGRDLFIMPDENYLNILQAGNYIYPEEGQRGYDWYFRL